MSNIEDFKHRHESLSKLDWSPWVYVELNWGDLCDEGSGRSGLLLTINFSKHFMKVLGGRVWFGLRSGELKLEPINATIPYKHRWPQSSLAVEIKTKRSISKTSGSKQAQSDTKTLDAKADFKDISASLSSSSKREMGLEQSALIQDDFEHTVWQVYTKGSEQKAYWDFEVARSLSDLGS